MTTEQFTSAFPTTAPRRSAIRRRSSLRRDGFDFAIADRIDLLNPLHWAQCQKGGNSWGSIDYFRVLELCTPGNVSLRFALIYDGSAPVAAVSIQVVELPLGGAGTVAPADDSARRFSRAMRRRHRVAPTETKSRRALVCGDIFSCRSPLPGQADISPELVWKGVSEALQRIFEQEKMSLGKDFILLKDTLAEDAGAMAAFRERGYQRLRVEPAFSLPLSSKWECYSDYVEHLKPIQRKFVHKLQRDRAEAGLSSRLYRSAGDIAKLDELDIRPLQSSSLFPSTWRLGDLVTGLLRDSFSAASALRVHAMNGIPISLTLVVREEGAARNHFWGRCGDTPLPACLADAMMQGVVEDAIQLGCRTLDLGRTAAARKLRLGAQSIPREAWVLHRNSEEAFDLAPLFRVVNHEGLT